MKTKNMRKKALVASLAMLLVAVVALGGATYAWFTSNTVALAKGLSFVSDQPSSLLFAPTGTTLAAEDADDWTGEYNIPTGQTPTGLTPVSSNDVTTFYQVTAVNAAASGGETASTVKTFSAGGTAYSHSFLVKSTAENTALYLTGLTATDTNGNITPAMRVAVQLQGNDPKIFKIGGSVPAQGSEVYAVSAYNSGSFTADGITFAEMYAGTSKNGITFTQQSLNPLGTCLSSTTAIPANTIRTITITVWLEGNDPACDNSVMGQAINNFRINFSTAAS